MTFLKLQLQMIFSAIHSQNFLAVWWLCWFCADKKTKRLLSSLPLREGVNDFKI